MRISIDMTEGPAPRLTVLGIQIDTVAMNLSLRSLLRERRGRGAATRRDLESLVGTLQHTASVVRPGRLFLRRVYDLLAGTSHFKQVPRASSLPTVIPPDLPQQLSRDVPPGPRKTGRPGSTVSAERGSTVDSPDLPVSSGAVSVFLLIVSSESFTFVPRYSNEVCRVASNPGPRTLLNKGVFIGHKAAACEAVWRRAWHRGHATSPCGAAGGEEAPGDAHPLPASAHHELRVEAAQASLGTVCRGGLFRYADAVGRRVYVLLWIPEIGRGNYLRYQATTRGCICP